jgi:hypothetical protein
MTKMLQPNPFWDELEAEHRSWLSAYHGQYLRKWDQLRANNNEGYEAALCEAATRRLLQRHTIKVEPNEDLTGMEQRPDFRCTHPEGTFLVEVACIPIGKAIEETGLPHPPQFGVFQSYRHLNDAFFLKSKGKAGQCANATEPTMVAVGTFHDLASYLCVQKKFADMLLTGETSLSWLVDTQTGRGVGDAFQTTELYSAPFFGQGQPQISDARCSISGMLLCGFGFSPPKVLGVLHPNAIRPFNPRLLPGIAFGEVRVDHATGQFSTSWSGGLHFPKTG